MKKKTAPAKKAPTKKTEEKSAQMPIKDLEKIIQQAFEAGYAQAFSIIASTEIRKDVGTTTVAKLLENAKK